MQDAFPSRFLLSYNTDGTKFVSGNKELAKFRSNMKE